jgi:two-component system, cell cycle sensor histidine kinase and response regulator CckA
MEDQPVRILLIDDEPSLLRLMQTFLTRLGYAVEACADGKSGMAAFEAAPGQFQLLVADVTLPDISGQDLAVQLATRDPNLLVLLCSGYPVHLAALPDNVRPRFDALEKPFLPNMLAGAVEKMVKKKS